MKLAGMIGTAILSLAIAAPMYAQQEQHEQKEEDTDKTRPAKEGEKKAQSEAPAKQAEKNTRPEEKSAKHEPQAKPEKQAQHGGGGRIPADKYQAHFGSSHSFRVNEGDYRNHRFQYGGYWFGFVDPWPSNWLYTQNVYVVEIGGMYYLCNPVYPGVNLAINVTL